MTYVLVLRDTDAKVSRVWTGRELNQVLRKVTAFAFRQQYRWPKEADDYILANYLYKTATAIAEHLTKQLGRRVTKNAVIGRYNRLKRHVRVSGDTAHE